MTSAECSSKRKLIVAIDGPSGAGKSSVTKAVAERLGYTHIDTGAMFRVVALMASRNGIDAEDDHALADMEQHVGRLQVPMHDPDRVGHQRPRLSFIFKAMRG